VLTST